MNSAKFFFTLFLYVALFALLGAISGPFHQHLGTASCTILLGLFGLLIGMVIGR